MKRRRIFALLLSTAVFTTAFFPLRIFAEKQAASPQLRGLIMEVYEDGILLNDPNLGEVILNVSPETVLEGVLAERPLAKGMYVLSQYNGRVTRTDPPQSHADRLACYPLAGIVAELLPDGILLTGDPMFGDVHVRLSKNMPRVFEDIPVTVYYDGTMTLSRPGKVAAHYIVVPAVRGLVRSVAADSLILDIGYKEPLAVKLSDSTLMPASWFDGNLKGRTVIVYYDGDYADGKINALEVLDPTSIVKAYLPLDDHAEEEEETAAVLAVSSECGQTPASGQGVLHSDPFTASAQPPTNIHQDH